MPDDLPHGRRRYQKGCRCAVCKQANREYARTYRARNALHVVTGAPAAVAAPANGLPGPVEFGVRAELDGLALAEQRPALVAIAYALARVLDDPAAIPQHPTAAHRLAETLDKLSKGSRGRTRLASVQQMTPRGRH
jgi:hypothetical protein